MNRIATVIVWSMILGISSAWGQDQDAQEGPVLEQLNPFGLPANQFDLWVFSGMSGAKAAQVRLEKRLGLHIEEVDRVCELSESQKKKLQLAGYGDVKRFFDAVEVARRKFMIVRQEQERVNEMWNDIAPLREAFSNGLFNENSFFRKSLPSTLSELQSRKLEELEVERRRFSFQARVELVVAILEKSIPLRADQRQEFIVLVMQITPLPRLSGTDDYQLVLQAIAQVPEEKLRPLFDDREWRFISARIRDARR